MACPACSSTRNTLRNDLGAQIYECRKCGAIHGTCYLGDSYSIVRPHLTDEPVPADRMRYFDLLTLGSEGLTRRHGWFDQQTRLVVQIG